MPLFVYRHGSEIAISPSLVKLLVEGAASDIDEAALSVFLRLGFFVGDDTPFVSISTLPPGCELTWTSRGCDVSGGPYLVAATSVTWHAAIETAAALMHQAITRRLPVDQRFVVPLSGGRDSRHILLELDRCGYRPDFVVTVPRYPPAAPEDVRVASRVSAALGVRHKLLEPTEPRALAEARKNVATHF